MLQAALAKCCEPWGVAIKMVCVLVGGGGVLKASIPRVGPSESGSEHSTLKPAPGAGPASTLLPALSNRFV